MERICIYIISGPPRTLFPLLARLLLLAVLFPGIPASLQAQNAAGLTLYYSIQQTAPEGDDAAKLKSFFQEKYPEGGAVVVQGFGCDTGGYERSLYIARRRGEKAVGLVRESGIDRKNVLLSRPIVFYGEPRTKHRRVRITVFKDLAAARASLGQANGRSRTTNKATKQKLDADAERERELEKAEQEQREREAEAARKELEAQQARAASKADWQAGAGASGASWWPGWNIGAWPWYYRLLLVLLFLLLLLLLYLLYERYEANKKRESHQLSGEEAEALEVLTGGAVTPVAPVKPASKAKKKRSKIVSKLTRKLPMAKKKAKKQITPLNIHGAVDKEFEGQTLNQIRRAPIHALEGLTPRHATLLKEGFGIDTIEDLAKLKYFEIAKAITVLAKYEK